MAEPPPGTRRAELLWACFALNILMLVIAFSVILRLLLTSQQFLLFSSSHLMYTYAWNLVFYKALFFLSIVPVYRAVLVNRTIDSNKGDPVTGFVPIYQPRNQQSPWDDQTCSECWIQPDITLAYDGTWNAATYNPGMGDVSITLHFTGVAIWVFFILSNANKHGPSTTANTQVNITLDGQYAGNFSHNPDMSTEVLIYNATIFAQTGLKNTSHELVIATNDYPISTFINFDWAIYTADVNAPASHSISSSTTASTINPSSSTSSSSSSSSAPSQISSSKIGIIVGCTIGGLAVIALVVVFAVRRLHRPPAVRNEKIEGILNIDALPRQPPNGIPQTSQFTHLPPSSSSGARSPVRDHAPARRRAETLRDADQMEIDRRILSIQREKDSLRSLRNAMTAGEIGGSSQTGQPLHASVHEITLLIDEVQQLRDEIGYLQSHRGPNLSPSSANAPRPPAYH